MAQNTLFTFFQGFVRLAAVCPLRIDLHIRYFLLIVGFLCFLSPGVARERSNPLSISNPPSIEQLEQLGRQAEAQVEELLRTRPDLVDAAEVFFDFLLERNSEDEMPIESKYWGSLREAFTTQARLIRWHKNEKIGQPGQIHILVKRQHSEFRPVLLSFSGTVYSAGCGTAVMRMASLIVPGGASSTVSGHPDRFQFGIGLPAWQLGGFFPNSHKGCGSQVWSGFIGGDIRDITLEDLSYRELISKRVERQISITKGGHTVKGRVRISAVCDLTARLEEGKDYDLRKLPPNPKTGLSPFAITTQTAQGSKIIFHKPWWRQSSPGFRNLILAHEMEHRQQFQQGDKGRASKPFLREYEAFKAESDYAERCLKQSKLMPDEAVQVRQVRDLIYRQDGIHRSVDEVRDRLETEFGYEIGESGS